MPNDPPFHWGAFVTCWIRTVTVLIQHTNMYCSVRKSLPGICPSMCVRKHRILISDQTVSQSPTLAPPELFLLPALVSDLLVILWHTVRSLEKVDLLNNHCRGTALAWWLTRFVRDKHRLGSQSGSEARVGLPTTAPSDTGPRTQKWGRKFLLSLHFLNKFFFFYSICVGHA